MIGFETIGNATLTAFDDGKSILATDPWIDGNPYFGSWGHKYQLPSEQIKNISDAKYIWLSHGHPDHVDAKSFHYFRGSTLLIPDHFGDRMFNYFNSRYDCIKIKSNEWMQLSPNIRVKSFSDWNQDASLLVEIMGKDIIFNQNDGNSMGWGKTIRQILKQYENRFLLRLINWGDADMINLYDESGNFIKPQAANRPRIGKQYSRIMKNWGCNYAIPFSSLHKYIRDDAVSMNEYITPLDEHYNGFDSSSGELLPAFIRWDSVKEDYEQIAVVDNETEILSAESVGDTWSDELDSDDKANIESYFKKFENLPKHFGVIGFRVGGKDFEVRISDKPNQVFFEAPRKSLMNSIRNEIFDDMLIGNFMKTTLVGSKSLYPHFTPYVAKYGDNGTAHTDSEIKDYFNYYKLNSADYWRDMLMFRTEQIIREFVSPGSSIYSLTKSIKQRLH